MPEVDGLFQFKTSGYRTFREQCNLAQNALAGLRVAAAQVTNHAGSWHARPSAPAPMSERELARALFDLDRRIARVRIARPEAHVLEVRLFDGEGRELPSEPFIARVADMLPVNVVFQ